MGCTGYAGENCCKFWTWAMCWTWWICGLSWPYWLFNNSEPTVSSSTTISYPESGPSIASSGSPNWMNGEKKHFYLNFFNIRNIIGFNLPSVSQLTWSVFTKNVREILNLSSTPYAVCKTGPSGTLSRVKIQTDSVEKKKKKNSVKKMLFFQFFISWIQCKFLQTSVSNRAS